MSRGGLGYRCKVNKACGTPLFQGFVQSDAWSCLQSGLQASSIGKKIFFTPDYMECNPDCLSSFLLLKKKTG